MAVKYLINTSVVIKYLNGSVTTQGLEFLDNVINDCQISFITEIELQVWNPRDDTDLIVYQRFVEQTTSIGIDQISYPKQLRFENHIISNCLTL